MSLYILNIEARPAQKVMVTFGTHQLTLNLRQIGGRQYISVKDGEQWICKNVLMVNDSYVINNDYQADFDLFPIDVQGKESSPKYNGWMERYFLLLDDAPERV